MRHGPVPVLDAPHEGLTQMAGGTETIRNARDHDETMGGISELLRGAMKVGEPLLPAAGIAAPLETGLALGYGGIGAYGGETVARDLGAGPGASALIGDVAGLGFGGRMAARAPELRAAVEEAGGVGNALRDISSRFITDESGEKIIRDRLRGLWSLPILDKIRKLPSENISEPQLKKIRESLSKDEREALDNSGLAGLLQYRTKMSKSEMEERIGVRFPQVSETELTGWDTEWMTDAQVEPAGSNYRELLIRNENQPEGQTYYTPNEHRYTDPNILQHIRMNDYYRKKPPPYDTVWEEYGPAAEKLLAVQEHQGDWFQQGRKVVKQQLDKADEWGHTPVEIDKLKEQGYFQPFRNEDLAYHESGLTERLQELNAERDQLDSDLFDRETEDMTPAEERHLQYLRAERNAKEDLIHKLERQIAPIRGEYLKPPDPPFKNEWIDLGIKRMLQEAAHGDYDAIVWTTAKQQTERSYGKQVRRWQYDPYGQMLYAHDEHGSPMPGHDRLSVQPHQLPRFLHPRDLAKGEELARLLEPQIERLHERYGKPRTFRDYFVEFEPDSTNPRTGGLYRLLDPEGVVLPERYDDLYLAEGGRDRQALKYNMNQPRPDRWELPRVDVPEWLNRGLEHHYDKAWPAFLKKYGRKFGLKPEDIQPFEVPGVPNPFHGIYLPYELKRNIRMNGQYLYGTDLPSSK